MDEIARLHAIVSAEVDNAVSALQRIDSLFDEAGASAARMDSTVERSGRNVGQSLKEASQQAFYFTQNMREVGQLASGAFDALNEGARGLELESAFRSQLDGTGQAFDDFMARLESASGGTIAQFDLMATASRSMTLNLTSDADEIATLLEFARLRAQKLGIDTTQAFDDIVTGLSRNSALILDNLGIVVDSERAYGAYADSIGVTVDELTEAERVQALLNDTLIVAREELGAVGGVADSTADSYRRLSVEIANAKSEWLGILAVAGAGLLNEETPVGEVLTGIFDPNAAAETLQQMQALQEGIRQAYAVIGDVSLLEMGRIQLALYTEGAAGLQEILSEYPGAWEAFLYGVEGSATATGLLAQQVDQVSAALDSSSQLVYAAAAGVYDLETASYATAAGIEHLSGRVADLGNQEFAAEIAARAAADGLSEQELRTLSVADASAYLHDWLVDEAVAAGIAQEEALLLADALSATEIAALGAAGGTDVVTAAMARAAEQAAIARLEILRFNDAMDAVAARQQGLGPATPTQADRARRKDELDRRNAARSRLEDIHGGRPTESELQAQSSASTSYWRRYWDQIEEAAASAGRSTGRSLGGGARTGLSESERAAKKAAAEWERQTEAAAREMQREWEQASRKMEQAGKRAADSLRNRVAAAIDFDISVSDEDVLLTQMGLYEDQVFEAGRRLQDVINRGFESPWVDAFAELDRSSDQALRASAARLKQQAEDWLRPDLLNKDAIKQQVRESIIGEQNKQAFIDEIARELAPEFGEMEVAAALRDQFGTDTLADMLTPPLTLLPDVEFTLPEDFEGDVDTFMADVNAILAEGQRSLTLTLTPQLDTERGTLFVDSLEPAIARDGERMGSQLAAGILTQMQLDVTAKQREGQALGRALGEFIVSGASSQGGALVEGIISAALSYLNQAAAGA